jgi:DNA-binding beta-propeller fold protein YncE
MPPRQMLVPPPALAAATLALLALLAAAGPPAAAQIAVSVNDNKAVLEDGTMRVQRESAPDTLSVIDLSASPPRLRAEIPVPASVVGPPASVAITPDERLALVTANQKRDPSEPSKTVPGDSLAVVDLTSNPPRVLTTLPTGAGPAGLSINRAGTLALVANRNAGTVSVFRIQGGEVTPAATVEVAPAASGVSHAAITPDGRHALVTRDNDNFVTVLRIGADGRVEKTGRDISPGLRPYGLTITPDGRWAVVANIGRGGGDSDTVSLIDLQKEPFRIVDTVSVGQTPEGIAAAPDNRHVAVTVMNGSNKPRNSPFHGTGQVVMLRIEDGGRLSVASRADVGTWSQGAAFSPDGRTLLVGNMVERNLSVLQVGADGKLTDTGTRIAVSGGSAALRTAEK